MENDVIPLVPLIFHSYVIPFWCYNCNYGKSMEITIYGGEDLIYSDKWFIVIPVDIGKTEQTHVEIIGIWDFIMVLLYGFLWFFKWISTSC